MEGQLGPAAPHAGRPAPDRGPEHNVHASTAGQQGADAHSWPTQETATRYAQPSPLRAHAEASKAEAVRSYVGGEEFQARELGRYRPREVDSHVGIQEYY